MTRFQRLGLCTTKMDRISVPGKKLMVGRPVALFGHNVQRVRDFLRAKIGHFAYRTRLQLFDGPGPGRHACAPCREKKLAERCRYIDVVEVGRPCLNELAQLCGIAEPHDLMIQLEGGPPGGLASARRPAAASPTTSRGASVHERHLEI